MSHYLVKSNVQKYIQSSGKKTSGEIYEALEHKLLAIIDEAISRAGKNDRQTVMPRDV